MGARLRGMVPGGWGGGGGGGYESSFMQQIVTKNRFLQGGHGVPVLREEAVVIVTCSFFSATTGTGEA